MAVIFAQVLPFFLIIALGYGSVRMALFDDDASAYLSKFVFYFALPAMLFRFSANLSLGEVFDLDLVLCYGLATGALYALGHGVAVSRGQSFGVAAIEAQCTVIGNVGFLGIPMLSLLLGPGAIAFTMQLLALDIIVFGTLIVVLLTIAKEGRFEMRRLGALCFGVVKNPMLASIFVGLLWSQAGWSMPEIMQSFLQILGNAATPGALFAIGMSLAVKSAERIEVALWLSFAKLILHPSACFLCALLFFDLAPAALVAMVAAASLPVAGNIFILAQHFNVAPQRVSSAILVSTLAALVSFTWILVFIQNWVAASG